LKGATLPLDQLWNQGLDKPVQRDVLKILSRIASRPATTSSESHESRTPAAAAISGAARQSGSNPPRVVSRENADD
jgi:hypothetical protein